MEEEKKEQKAATPKFFYGANDLIDIVVTGYYAKDTGFFEFAIPGETEEKEAKTHFSVVKHVFRFSRVPYDRLNFYRERASRSDENGGRYVDGIRLRSYLWASHLKEWNLTGEDGVEIALGHTPEGTLDGQSLKLLYQLPASLLDTIITLFERKISIA